MIAVLIVILEGIENEIGEMIKERYRKRYITQ
jgi:hypothetical protein